MHSTRLNCDADYGSQAGSSTLTKHLNAVAKHIQGVINKNPNAAKRYYGRDHLKDKYFSLPHGDPTSLRRVQAEPFTFMFVRDPATHVFAAFDNRYEERKTKKRPFAAYEMFRLLDNKYVAQHVLNLTYVFTFSSCTAQDSAQSRQSCMPFER